MNNRYLYFGSHILDVDEMNSRYLYFGSHILMTHRFPQPQCFVVVTEDMYIS